METYSIPYGKEDIAFNLKKDRVIFKGEMERSTPLGCLKKELLFQLDNPTGTPPLGEMVRGKKNVLILIEDNTRNTPLKEILPVLLGYLNDHGIEDSSISFLTAPGTHRIMTEKEIEEKVGSDIKSRYRIYQHDATIDEDMVTLESVFTGSYEIPVEVNRKALEADFIMGIGNIVPHSDAGFSGGGKILQPGICGFSSTSATHASAALSGEIPLGVVENPCRHGIEKVARKVGLAFIINTVKSEDDNVVAIIAGDMIEAHREGARLAKKAYQVSIPQQADILVVSSSPCDIDYWQANKAISTAWFAVKPGGIVIFVSPCTEGLACNHPRFREWLSMPLNKILPRITSADPGNRDLDLISAVLATCNARVREKASIFAVTDGLTDEDLKALGYRGFSTLKGALEEAMKLKPDGTVGILPHGGISLPVIVPGGDVTI